MNELRVIKVAELRKKMGAIPAKMGIALLLEIALLWDTSLETIWAKAMAEPLKHISIFVFIYGLISYVYFFIKLLRSKLFGIIGSVVATAVVYSYRDKLGNDVLSLLMMAMFFGGPVCDLLLCFRYFRLRRKVIRESERAMERSYERGFDSGYERGMRERDRREEAEYARHWHRRWEELAEDEPEDYERIDDRESYGYRGYRTSGEDPGRDDGYESRRESVPEPRREEVPRLGFFGDCTDEASIKRRYRDLCKVYHPDSGNGSVRIFEAIQDEYETLMGEKGVFY